MKVTPLACGIGFFLALACGQNSHADELRTAREIRELSVVEANRPHRAEITGIVLGLAEPFGSSLAVQDATDPIYITGPASMISGLAPGDMVRVRGSTDAGGFAPYLRADEIQKIGRGTLPEPRRVSSEELYNTGLDAHWIAVNGVVRSVRDVRADEMPRGPDPARMVDQANNTPDPTRRMKMTLAVADRVVPVLLYGRWDARQLVDAEVEVRGLCFNQHNAERQFLNVLILIPRGTELHVLREPPGSPFDAPAVSPRALFGFSRNGISRHRIHVDGVVLHQILGSGLWIRQDDVGLFVQTDSTAPLAPGDRVQVAGFPERGAFSPVLADAVFRKIEHGAEPVPTRLTERSTALRHNGDLVVFQGILAGQKETEEGLVLRVDWQGMELPVIYTREPATTATLPPLEIGSLLSVTGICAFSSARDVPLSGMLVPDKFSVVMRRSSDLAVLRPPPWWTSRRLAFVLSATIALLAAVLATVFIGSRRRLVRERARQAASIAEYSARLAERSRMARELHDTLAQGLGAISLQLELTANRMPAEQNGSSEHLAIAQRLVRTSMAEVRSFIRNLRKQTQQDVELASALEELLRTATEGTPIVRQFQQEGPIHRLSSNIEAQIIQITQEAVSNAVRHSGANTISVRVKYRPTGLVVTIADDGTGFDAAADWSERLHFGLLGMKERANLMGSTLTITAADGRGTRVTLEVPHDAVATDSLSL